MAFKAWRHVSRERCKSDGYQGCDVEVKAFEPRDGDPPHEVRAELGDEVLGEQCDNCGSDTYTRVESGVRCDGCGYVHRIFTARGCEIIPV